MGFFSVWGERHPSNKPTMMHHSRLKTLVAYYLPPDIATLVMDFRPGVPGRVIVSSSGGRVHVMDPAVQGEVPEFDKPRPSTSRPRGARYCSPRMRTFTEPLMTFDCNSSGGPVITSHSGELVYMCGSNHTIEARNIRSGKVQMVFRGHKQEVTNLCLFANGTRLMSSGKNEGVPVWNTLTGQWITVLRFRDVYDMTLSPDGRLICLQLHKPDTLCVLDAQTFEIVWTKCSHDVGAHCWSSDGRFLLVGKRHDIYVYRSTDGVGFTPGFEKVRSFSDQDASITLLAAIPNSQQVFSTSSDGSTAVWDIPTRRCLYVLGCYIYAERVAFHGSYMFALSHRGVMVHDMDDYFKLVYSLCPAYYEDLHDLCIAA